jgi:CHAD domain-containing protein
MAGLPRLRSAFHDRLDAFTRELPGVEKGGVGALHRSRVASRRLRELIPLLALDRRTSHKLNRGLKKACNRLGIVRELDVLCRVVDEYGHDKRSSPAALERVGAAVARARHEARERVIDDLLMAKLARLAARLKRAGQALEPDDAEDLRGPREGRRMRAQRWALQARVTSRAARAEAAIESSSSVYASEQLHGVRIALKKLRYAAELSEHPASRQLTADIAMLKAGQDILGRLHDLELFLAWGREVQASLSPPDVNAWRELRALVDTVEDDCRRLHARFMGDRAKLLNIAHRLGAGRHTIPTSRRAIG